MRGEGTGCVMPVQVQGWILSSLDILIFCSSWIFFLLFILVTGCSGARASIIISVLWVSTTGGIEVRNVPEVPRLNVLGLGYSPGLLGPRLGTAVCLASAGIVEFSGTCFSSRSGKRLKKTRKYDIITTPAERVEMAPLNEEDDEDEDSTVFDIKYRYGGKSSSVYF